MTILNFGTRKRECAENILAEETNLIDELMHESKWSGALSIHTSGLNKSTFVYKLYHEEYDDCYIGCTTHWSSRKTKIIGVFNNEGNATIHSGGGASDHPGARKMYNIDSNLDNWKMKVMLIDFADVPFDQSHRELIIRQIETHIIQEENPSLNSDGMAGR